MARELKDIVYVRVVANSAAFSIDEAITYLQAAKTKQELEKQA